jgi:hypothetical protein
MAYGSYREHMHRVGPLSVLLAGSLLLAVFLVMPVKVFSGYSISGGDVTEIWVDCGTALSVVVSGRFSDDVRGGYRRVTCVKAARGRLLEAAVFSLPVIGLGAVWLIRARPTKPISVLGPNPWMDGS